MAVNNAMDEPKDSIIAPKAPARKISSHKSVVHLKKSKFEADDREKLNSSELRLRSSPRSSEFILNKTNLASNAIKMQKRPLNDENGKYEDEGVDLNWRPLRDFF